MKRGGNHGWDSRRIALLGLGVLLLSGCAQAVDLQIAEEVRRSGFLHGWLHGAIALFAWIGSWFNEEIAIYDVYNTGKGYDLGFLLGVGGAGFSIKIGLGGARRGRRRR